MKKLMLLGALLALATVSVAFGAGDIPGDWFFANKGTKTINLASTAGIRFSATSDTGATGSFDAGVSRNSAGYVSMDGATKGDGLAALVTASVGPDATHQMTLPSVSGGALVTTAGTQTLTNKTITAPVLSGSATGTYTLAGTPTITAPAISTPTISGTWDFTSATLVGVDTWPKTVPTGLGAISQANGPTDQTFWIKAADSASAPKNISITAGSATGTGTGANVSIDAGAGNSGAGAGTIAINGGTASGTSPGGSGHGGSITVTGGPSGTGSANQGGGTITLAGGSTLNNNASGGPVIIAAGSNNGSGAGGAVTIKPGMSTSGTDGTVILQGSSSHSASTVMTISGLSAVMTSGTVFDISAADGIVKLPADHATGATTALLGTACPGASGTVHWKAFKDSDGSTIYIATWK